MHTTSRIALLSMLTVIMTMGVAHAAPKGVESYALLIGTNASGEGQQDLHFAEEDAKRVSEVLQTLGQTPTENIQLTLRPTRAELEAQLDTLAARLTKRHEQGLQSQLLVYYSGHARANSLVLGEEEMALSELRTRLLALPSTLIIILLDACQSGAFSRIKGIDAAEDFSLNSVNRLQSAGVAVMASSSATELSQESERLRSSFFTHHLLIGLRGAGDSDQDGRITLSEAYRYAYNTTLVDTTKTRVGTQHVTLETDLKGKGEVILTYPKTASSQLAFSQKVEGKIVIQQKKSGSVVAELHKAKGNVALALPAGEYVVLVRQRNDIRRCQIELRQNQKLALQPANYCEAVTDGDMTVAKGGASAPPATVQAVMRSNNLRFSVGTAYTSSGTQVDSDAEWKIAIAATYLRGVDRFALGAIGTLHIDGLGVTHGYFGGMLGLAVPGEYVRFEVHGEGGLHSIFGMGSEFLSSTEAGSPNAWLPYLGMQTQVGFVLADTPSGSLQLVFSGVVRSDLSREKRELTISSLGSQGRQEEYQVGGASVSALVGLGYDFN